MNKKVILTSVAVLSTFASMGTPLVVNAANTNVIVGPSVKEADPTIGHSDSIGPVSKSNSDQQVIVQATNNYATPAEQQAFMAKVVPIAQQIAAKYNIYASVMLAQAIIESGWGKSDLAVYANNLFGLKGSYNGSTYLVPTREWSNSLNDYYWINANFSKYPSYYESFADNGNKIRNGVSWDSSYYKGAWKENASSYKDATAWLQGRYATEPHYAEILNNTIATYNLSQYDGSAETNGGSQDDATTGTVHVKVTPYARIYNNDNKLISNRALMSNSDWYFNRTKTDSNGTTWYHVATNEWVSSSDVYKL